MFVYTSLLLFFSFVSTRKKNKRPSEVSTTKRGCLNFEGGKNWLIDYLSLRHYATLLGHVEHGIACSLNVHSSCWMGLFRGQFLNGWFESNISFLIFCRISLDFVWSFLLLQFHLLLLMVRLSNLLLETFNKVTWVWFLSNKSFLILRLFC